MSAPCVGRKCLCAFFAGFEVSLHCASREHIGLVLYVMYGCEVKGDGLEEIHGS